MEQQAIHILIVEDEELFASKMEMQVDKLGHNCVGIADNHRDALNILNDHVVDLILMDINITGDYDGIELAQEINQTRDIPILYVTSNVDDLSFNRATRAGAVGFIVKPFSDIQLRRAIALAIKQQDQNKTEEEQQFDTLLAEGSLFVKKKDEIKKVQITDIYYIEADGRYCRIYTQQEMFLVRRSLKELLAKLPQDSFMQCHRSYAVNLKKIKSINVADDLIILEERSVPISRREKDKLIEKINYL